MVQKSFCDEDARYVKILMAIEDEIVTHLFPRLVPLFMLHIHPSLHLCRSVRSSLVLSLSASLSLPPPSPSDMDDYERHVRGLKKELFSLIKPDDTVVELGAGA